MCQEDTYMQNQHFLLGLVVSWFVVPVLFLIFWQAFVMVELMSRQPISWWKAHLTTITRDGDPSDMVDFNVLHYLRHLPLFSTNIANSALSCFRFALSSVFADTHHWLHLEVEILYVFVFWLIKWWHNRTFIFGYLRQMLNLFQFLFHLFWINVSLFHVVFQLVFANTTQVVRQPDPKKNQGCSEKYWPRHSRRNPPWLTESLIWHPSCKSTTVDVCSSSKAYEILD